MKSGYVTYSNLWGRSFLKHCEPIIINHNRISQGYIDGQLIICSYVTPCEMNRLIISVYRHDESIGFRFLLYPNVYTSTE